MSYKILSDDSFKTKMDELNATLANIASNTGGLKITNYADIKEVFRRGLGKKLFGIGDVLRVYKEKTLSISVGDSSGITAATITEATFLAAMGEAVEGVYEAHYDGSVWHKEDESNLILSDYGIAVTGTPVDGDKLVITEQADLLEFEFTHVNDKNGYLLLKKLYHNFQYDAPELLFYVDATAYPNGLAAGTYNLVLSHGSYDGGTAQDSTYQFTTTEVIPAGGGIRHSTMGAYQSSSYTKAQITGGTFTTYNAAGTVIESSLTCTEGSSGTCLGTFTGNDPQYSSRTTYANCNFTERNAYGSNKWSESCLRKWLNSSASSWYASTNKFDRPCSGSNASAKGWLNGIDPGFLAIVLNTTNTTALSISDGYTSETTVDKFFLPSGYEVYGSKEHDITEGTKWDLFDGTGNEAKIKTLNGTATYWWLRTPNTGDGVNVRIAYPSGALYSYYYAYLSYGVAPACRIGVD
jgi:hypothetical protein